MAANGLTVIKRMAGVIAAWSNGVSKEKLIGVGFGSIGKEFMLGRKEEPSIKVRTPDMERCELYEEGLSARQVYLKNQKMKKEK